MGCTCRCGSHIDLTTRKVNSFNTATQPLLTLITSGWRQSNGATNLTRYAVYIGKIWRKNNDIQHKSWSFHEYFDVEWVGVCVAWVLSKELRVLPCNVAFTAAELAFNRQWRFSSQAFQHLSLATWNMTTLTPEFTQTIQNVINCTLRGQLLCERHNST